MANSDSNDDSNAILRLPPDVRKLARWYKKQTDMEVSPQTAGRLYRIADWLKRHRMKMENAQLVVSASDRWGVARGRSTRVRTMSERIGATKQPGGRTVHIWISPAEADPKRKAS